MDSGEEYKRGTDDRDRGKVNKGGCGGVRDTDRGFDRKMEEAFGVVDLDILYDRERGVVFSRPGVLDDL